MSQLENIDREEEFDMEGYQKSMPLSIQERLQTLKVYEVFKEKSKWGEFYRVYGFVLFLLGGYFLTVPFYNVICQTMGFVLP